MGSEIQARIAPLATLAVETDGALIVDAARRSDEALDRLADQAQEYYLVGFAPPEDARLTRGKYRRVSVKVARSGARVSTRTGYAVAPEQALADRRRAIDRALAAPFVQQGLKIDYTTYVLRGTESGRQRVVLSLTADLPVRRRPIDAADVVFVVRDTRDGHVVASGTDTIALPAGPRAGASLGTGAWRVQFSVPKGSYLMRTVVREPGGLVGSADRRIDVRELDGPGVAVSDLVVGSATSALPVRPLAYTDDGLSGLVETYARTAGELESLEVRMELRRQVDGVAVVSVAAELSEAEQDETGVSRRAQLLLPLERVPPGEYVVHAIVRENGELVGERRRQVEVLAGSEPALRLAGPGSSAAWTPLDVIQGHVAQAYVAWLGERAMGTPSADAARLARANQWEHVELQLRDVPAGVVPHALRGLALFAREDYMGAVAALRLARTEAPDDALTAFFLGWALEGAGDAPAALSAWRTAAHLDPSLVSAHLALADGYLRLAQPSLAVQAIEAALTKLPTSPELLAKLQQIQRQ
jgi:Flp pilus assembly protein TadD